MNDLPTPSGGPPAGGSINKEQEVGGIGAEAPFRASGQETELPPEVASSGVKIQPTSIPIPPPVSAMGVKPVGQNVSPAAPAVALPLSDYQIAQGLKQSIWSSWHWLAQWCVRKLKQIHGKLTRVRQ